jgi:hypothetical protein
MKIRATRLKRLIPCPNSAKSRRPENLALISTMLTHSVLAHEDVDGKPVATGHDPKTQPFTFSADEGADVGIDNETAVSTDYEPASSKFTGQIESVTIAVVPSKLTTADQKAIDDAGEAANMADD